MFEVITVERSERDHGTVSGLVRHGRLFDVRDLDQSSVLVLVQHWNGAREVLEEAGILVVDVGVEAVREVACISLAEVFGVKPLDADEHRH